MEYQIQDPIEWGPHFWKVLHTIAASYEIPNATNNTDIVSLKKGVYAFFWGMQWTIPCPTCRENYKKFWKENPIEEYLGTENDPNKFGPKGKLDEWVAKLHNHANRIHNEPEWKIEKVREIYDPTKMFDPLKEEEPVQQQQQQKTPLTEKGKLIRKLKEASLGFIKKNESLEVQKTHGALGHTNSLYFQTHRNLSLNPVIATTKSINVPVARTIVKKPFPKIASKPAKKKNCGCKK